jgi:hypothetical protein
MVGVAGNPTQIFQRAAEFAAYAAASDVRADVRDSYRRLAAWYAKLAAKRLSEEARTVLVQEPASRSAANSS